MFKLCPRSVLTVTALLLTFVTSSALGASGLRHETKRARHAQRIRRLHRSHHSRPGHGSSRGSGHGSVIVRTASTTTSEALLGDEAVESNRDWLSGGQAEAFSFQARASGSAGAAHVYVDSDNSARTLIVGLYTNASSHPGVLLSTGSLSSPHAGAWNTATVAPVSLVSGTTYWLAVLGTGGALHYRDHAHGTCTALTSAQINLPTLAASWSTYKAYTTCPISAYLTPATETFPVDPPGPVELAPPTDPTAPVESSPPADPTSPVEPSPPVEPTPPPPPVSSTPPTVAGTATEGQTLSATTGTWTGSPTSYRYQWQDCEAPAGNCSNVSGATAATHKLGSGDIGHKVRVVVTASNAGGSSSASSVPTATVLADPPPPPTASFTYSPTSPATGQQVTLNGTVSTCPDGPCTYAWSDDGSPTRPIPPLWPLGGGQTLQYTFSGAGTKYIRLVVTDAAGREATVEHNVVVEEDPSPPVAPSNTALPTASGTAQVGQTLTAGSGTWTGTAPIGYAYQWQDCNTLGEACVNIAGASASTYKLGAGDTGHTVRIVVTASNPGGSTPASSAASAVVTAAPPLSNTALPVISGVAREGETLSASNGTWTGEPSSFAYQWQDCSTLGASCSNIAAATASTYKLGAGDTGHTVRIVVTAKAGSGTATATSAQTAVVEAKEKQGATPTECFGHEEACGYPGPTDTGVEGGVTLTKHTGTVVVSEAGTTIKDEKIEGNLEIAASKVTVENVEVVASSQKKVCEKTGSTEGGGGLQVREHGSELATGVLIRHVTVHGVTQGCPESLAEGITMRESSSAANVRVEWSKVYWTRTCFFQSATWENDYCDDNGEIPGAHYDGIYDNGEGTTTAKPGLIVKHDTILMPHWQTAPLFLPNEQEVGEEHIEDNLLAGGGYLMYLAGAHGATPTVKGPVEVIDNRLARCQGKEVGAKTGGHHLCQGLAEENETTSDPLAPDSFGYFPEGGSYGELYSTYDAATDHFSGNYWDNNLEAAL
jgi:hypothetical protein